MNTRNTLTACVAVLMATWAFAPTASAQADIQSRTFTDAFSAELDFNEGAGIFDSTVPGTGPGDQTCAALLAADVGASLLVLFYLNGRIVYEDPVIGPGGLGNLVPNTVVASDITECATFTPGFTGDIGTDDIDNNANGGYIVQLPIASGTIFPGTELFWMLLCPTGDGVTTVTYVNSAGTPAQGDYVDACTSPVQAVYVGGGAPSVAPAAWGESIYAVDFLTAGGNGGIVSSNVAAQVFDPVALAFTTQADADYFELVTAADGVAGFLHTWNQHLPPDWSGINANGIAPSLGGNYCASILPPGAPGGVYTCITNCINPVGYVGREGDLGTVSLDCVPAPPEVACPGVACTASGLLTPAVAMCSDTTAVGPFVAGVMFWCLG